MALQFLLKLDASEQLVKVKPDNSGLATARGRGFVVREMLSWHYVAKVGCGLDVGIYLAPGKFSLRSLVTAFVHPRTIVVGKEEFMSSGWLLWSSRGLPAEASSAM